MIPIESIFDLIQPGAAFSVGVIVGFLLGLFYVIVIHKTSGPGGEA